MKKTTKGALAASAAAVLLVGGAGTLAFWSDSGTVDGGSITTGSVSLSDGTCGEWVYSTGSAAGTAVTAIVPGDAIARSCTFAVDGTGDHLTVSLSAPETVSVTPTVGSPTTLLLTAAASYQRDGAALPAGTSFAVDGPETLTALITVTFPYGAATTVNANDTQGMVGQLDDITIGLTQDQSSGANPNS